MVNRLAYGGELFSVWEYLHSCKSHIHHVTLAIISHSHKCPGQPPELSEMDGEKIQLSLALKVLSHNIINTCHAQF